MTEILDMLRKFDALRDSPTDANPPNAARDEIFTRSVSNEPPEFASDTDMASLPPGLRAALAKLGIDRLYSHQVEALHAARNGHNLVLESPTASGKTLCFNLPLLETLCHDRDATAMMIFPMKALANDQRRQLESLTTVLPDRYRKIESWLYDGDTDQEHRRAIRENPPAVLLTNPEMLHLSFLGSSEKWNERFLKRLRYLIVDEIHEYRGFFGTNVALLLRRFIAHLHQIGARPQIAMATATCANPLEHAERLTGQPFKLVRASRPMRPHRDFIFINPSIPAFRFYDIFCLRIAKTALALMSLGQSGIVFCPSRKFCEEACKLARREAEKAGLNPDAIVPYRAGYPADERRGIEDGLRDGRYNIVFSTNALEIGIDIGQLDACVLAGFPDNVMSAWQRLGRVGRGWDKHATVIYMALNTAVDQFYVANLESFLDRKLDEIILGIDNEELIDRHVPYLLNETNWSLTAEIESLIGDAFAKRAAEKCAGVRPLVGGKGTNYRRLDIRGGAGITYKLMYNGKEIGTISDAYVLREAYVGAVFNQLGKSYRVKAHGATEVLLEDADPKLRTDPKFYTTVHPNELLAGRHFRDTVAVHYGKLNIYENFSGYQVVDNHSGEVIDEVVADDTKKRSVRGFWMTIEKPIFDDAATAMEGLRVAEQLLRVGSSFVIPCDRHDIGTLTTERPPPTITFYETVPGGIGVAEKMLSVWRDVLAQGMKLADACKCSEGCPRCIHPSRYRTGDGLLRKGVGLRFAEALLELTSSQPDETFDPDLGGWRRS